MSAAEDQTGPALARRASSRRSMFDALPGGRVNYLEPKGDAGFFGPDSMAWKVSANPVALAVGGVAAVILELAEPRVRSGVWDHSTFRTDPLARMQRTGEASMIVTYGSTAAAQARIAMVTRMHERVSGVTPEGQAYTALEPDLMTWVHVTAGWGFLNAYRRYLEPGMSLADQDRYYAEGAALGRAFGAPDPPGSVAAVDALFDRLRPTQRPHPIIGEFLQIVSTTSPLGLAGRALQPLVVEAAIDLIPPDLQRSLGLPVRPLRRQAAHAVLTGLARVGKAVPSEIVRHAHERVGRPLR